MDQTEIDAAVAELVAAVRSAGCRLVYVIVERPGQPPGWQAVVEDAEGRCRTVDMRVALHAKKALQRLAEAGEI
jgi:hypothetical protein